MQVSDWLVRTNRHEGVVIVPIDSVFSMKKAHSSGVSTLNNWNASRLGCTFSTFLVICGCVCLIVSKNSDQSTSRDRKSQQGTAQQTEKPS